jgi:hypothetical protein
MHRKYDKIAPHKLAEGAIPIFYRRLRVLEKCIILGVS